MGLDKLIDYDAKRKTAMSFKSIYGDAMEAFIGAIYLDRGFTFCQSFIVKEILLTHLDIEDIIETDTNYKSKLIEWSQRNNKFVRFETIEDKSTTQQKQFKVQVIIDDDSISKGAGFSKKNAEQDAARRACETLEIT
jgi:ribonuclease-3